MQVPAAWLRMQIWHTARQVLRCLEDQIPLFVLANNGAT